MTSLHTAIIELRQQGLSQDEIGRRVGKTQSRISVVLAIYGHGVRTMPRFVSKAQRDGHGVDSRNEPVWEPYRILHPTVAKLVKERYMISPSALRGSFPHRAKRTLPW